MSSYAHIRRIAVILLAAVWGVVGVVAPAHAAEEDIHHVTQHHDFDGVNTAEDVESEGAVHPEHATHCHAGACHFHMMARSALGQSAASSKALRLAWPRDDIADQAELAGFFHPPRV
ncbi:hypothetical protein [Hyphococcus sp.]|uniref:hypothetical protein n=1 Tax=Hyphococcus sp. TaxID=2038636 RepID=UPI0035C695FE